MVVLTWHAFWVWEGWPALAAIAAIGATVGTIALAAATFVLARKTTVLAEASQNDVAAQFRPILAPTRFENQEFAAQTRGYDVPKDITWFLESRKDVGYWIALTNIGPGAALDIRGSIRDSDQTPRIDSTALGSGCEPELIWLPAPLPDRNGIRSVEFRYHGADGQRWISEVHISRSRAPDWAVVLADLRRG